MSKQIQTLKGFRDLLPEDVRIRDKIKQVLVDIFESFGFNPIETPTLEYKELLMGKYGDDADKLIYLFEDKGGRSVGLRYDLTVPTARFLSTKATTLGLPLKRYQIQNVFRADKPQRGRLREFIQCDIDTFGIKSPLADAEIIQIIYTALKNLKINDFVIQVNSRKVLDSILSEFSLNDKQKSVILREIDKLDKLSEEEVVDNLIKFGFNKNIVKNIFRNLKNASPDEELKVIFEFLKQAKISQFKFSPFMVRGLSYYTRTIFETKLYKERIGSITGGGRYDDLIKRLGGPDITGTGTSFGFERIFEIIKSRKIFTDQLLQSNRVLVTVFNPDFLNKSIEISNYLRSNNLDVEMYLKESESLAKQFKYANRRGIEWVVIIGPDEIQKDKITVKNMKTGKQVSLNRSKLLNFLVK